MPDLDGLEVAVFESRRAPEMARLVEAHGGRPLSAPSIRAAVLEPGPDAIELARLLRAEELDGILFLTQDGVESLVPVMAPVIEEGELMRCLRSLPVGARGPKTVAALHALGVEVVVESTPPHTSRQLAADFDAAHRLAGTHVALVEHGVHHAIARALLVDRGAVVLPVAVYRWILPEDVGPLNRAIAAIAEGSVRVALFTNGVQIDSAMGVASEQDLDEPLRDGLRAGVVGAIGPVCADRLRAFGIEPDYVPEETTMDALVRGVAERAGELLAGGPR